MLTNNLKDNDILLRKALDVVKIGKTFSNPKIVILMGLPGSGKSYVSNYLNEKYGFTALSGENISNALFGNSGVNFLVVYKILRQLATQLIKENHSIVIDSTNLKFSFRKQIYDEVCKKIKPVLIYLLVDDKTARNRINQRGVDSENSKDIKSHCSEETYFKFKEQIEEPTKDEFCYRLFSDENLLKGIDSIIK